MGICKWQFGPVCPVRFFLIKLWVGPDPPTGPEATREISANPVKKCARGWVGGYMIAR